jgi:secernin
MCDTWVAMKDATLEGRVIFAKNSDRPIFDCQPLLLQPRKRWPAGSRIQTEYVELPQAEVTFAHLGSSPYWCWGYEEGMNEWGVVIGNEAIYTKAFQLEANEFQQGKPASLGLLGMDMIRIALERCTTSVQAVELIGTLVTEYGQFGSGNPGRPHDIGSYDNAFIVADPNEAWILETAGRRWVARRLRQGCASISNELSIRTEWDLGSPDLIDYARQKGWWQEPTQASSKQVFDFAQAYIDEKVSRQISHIRVMRSKQLLTQRSGQITPQWMMRIARDHYEDTFLEGPYFDAANPDFLSLCMHVSPADFTWGNTASSCVAVLPDKSHDIPVFWWTPGPPCNGCYVPFFPHGSRLPEIVSKTGRVDKRVMPADQAFEDSFNSNSYWWLFRQLNDWIKGDPIDSLPGCYFERNTQVRARFNSLEEAFSNQLPEIMKQAIEVKKQSPGEMANILDRFTDACVHQVLDAIQDLTGNKNSNLKIH